MKIKRNYEIWKLIKDFPDYEISNMGRVKSLDRFIKYSNDRDHFHRGMILKTGRDTHGYPGIELQLKKKPKRRTIHSLVIGHFGKPKPTPKHECNHKDGDKTNNWNNNLEWMTAKQNTKHAIEIGLRDNKGENNVKAKLTEKEVKKIRRLHETERYYQIQLAKMFHISHSCAHRIITYKTWKYI